MLEDGLNKKLLSILKFNNGGMQRRELARRTGAPPTTIYDRLIKLELEGVVCKYKKKRMKHGKVLPGRPNILWSVLEE